MAYNPLSSDTISSSLRLNFVIQRSLMEMKPSMARVARNGIQKMEVERFVRSPDAPPDTIPSTRITRLESTGDILSSETTSRA